MQDVNTLQTLSIFPRLATAVGGRKYKILPKGTTNSENAYIDTLRKLKAKLTLVSVGSNINHNQFSKIVS